MSVLALLLLQLLLTCNTDIWADECAGATTTAADPTHDSSIETHLLGPMWLPCCCAGAGTAGRGSCCAAAEHGWPDGCNPCGTHMHSFHRWRRNECYLNAHAAAQSFSSAMVAAAGAALAGSHDV